jgi:hypothetical protein
LCYNFYCNMSMCLSWRMHYQPPLIIVKANFEQNTFLFCRDVKILNAEHIKKQDALKVRWFFFIKAMVVYWFYLPSQCCSWAYVMNDSFSTLYITLLGFMTVIVDVALWFEEMKTICKNRKRKHINFNTWLSISKRDLI